MTNAATPTGATPVEARAPDTAGSTATVTEPAPLTKSASKAASHKKSDSNKKAGANKKADASKKANPGKKSDPTKAVPEVRSAAQIQADIDAAQVRLASRVDELSDRLNPQHLAEEAVGGVKRLFVHEDGSPKGKPIALVAGGVTALLVLRKIFHR